jgi:DNA-binding transcriptional LysR family regulator
MTLEQLRIFIAVAEKQHVTQAARTLGLTQSAASSAIAALETRYDIKLFDRIGRGIVLTRAGQRFLEEAKAVIARAKDAERVIGEIAGLKQGTLAVGASQTVANYWLPPRLPAFQKAHPGLDLQIRIGNTETVAGFVHDGEADIGFVEGEVDDPLLSVRRIEGDTLVVVVGATHPWAKLKSFDPRMLPSAGWVLREPGSGTRAMFETAIRKYGLKLSDLNIRLQLSANEAVRNAVETGAYATAISDVAVARGIAAKRLCRVPLKLPARPYFILRHRERHLSGAAAALLSAFGLPD